MSRSVKKGPFIAKSLYKKVILLKGSQGKKIVQTYSRSSTIIPEMIDFVISVHNGKAFIPVYITENLVGHKLGEFAPTRFFKVHSGNR